MDVLAEPSPHTLLWSAPAEKVVPSHIAAALGRTNRLLCITGLLLSWMKGFALWREASGRPLASSPGDIRFAAPGL